MRVRENGHGVVIFVLLLATLAINSVPSSAQADRRVTLDAAAGFATPLDKVRPMAALTLGVHVPIGDWIGLEVLGAAGITPGDAQDARMLLRLTGGLRLEQGVLGQRFYASFRVAHVHDAPLHVWEHHLGASLAGDATHGLSHLTAMGGAVGAAFAITPISPQLSVAVEAELLGLIVGKGSSGWFTLTASLGWGF